MLFIQYPKEGNQTTVGFKKCVIPFCALGGVTKILVDS